MKANGFDKRFGKRIRNARKSLGLRQKELAQLLGISRTYVTMWENGLHIPSQIQLIALANVLCVPITDLNPNFDFDVNLKIGREFLRGNHNVQKKEIPKSR